MLLLNLLNLLIAHLMTPFLMRGLSPLVGLLVSLSLSRARFNLNQAILKLVLLCSLIGG